MIFGNVVNGCSGGDLVTFHLRGKPLYTGLKDQGSSLIRCLFPSALAGRLVLAYPLERGLAQFPIPGPLPKRHLDNNPRICPNDLLALGRSPLGRGIGAAIALEPPHKVRAVFFHPARPHTPPRCERQSQEWRVRSYCVGRHRAGIGGQIGDGRNSRTS